MENVYHCTASVIIQFDVIEEDASKAMAKAKRIAADYFGPNLTPKVELKKV